MRENSSSTSSIGSGNESSCAHIHNKCDLLLLNAQQEVLTRLKCPSIPSGPNMSPNSTSASYDCNRKLAIAALVKNKSCRVGLATIRALRTSLLEDTEFVTAAMDAGVVRVVQLFCPTASNNEKNNSSTKKKEVSFWEVLPAHIQTNRQVAFRALMNDVVESLSDLPASLQNDHDFCFRLIAARGDYWNYLPTQFQTIKFARNIQSYEEPLLPHTILGTFPELCHDLTTWQRIVATTSEPAGFDALLLNYAPNEILTDHRELMQAACRLQPKVLKVVRNGLARDPTFVEPMLQQSDDHHGGANVFGELPKELQLHFQHYFLQACTDPNQRASVRGSAYGVVTEVWTNYDIVEAWCKHAGGWYMDAFPEHYQHDKQLFLWMAEYDMSAVTSFRNASQDLLSDFDFMSQAISLNPELFRTASSDLQMNMDLAISAVAGLQRIWRDFPYIVREASSEKQQGFMAKLMHRVREKVESHKGFAEAFVFGFVDPESSISCLEQGSDTALALKKQIASYLGVPTGKELRKFRQAWVHISTPS